MAARVRLARLAGAYTVCRLDPSSPIPGWADGEGFSSISRSDDELSIVCRAERVPAGVRQDGGWACYKFIGPFAFDETGIVSAVIGPLSAAGIGIFVVSTFDGDHMLIKQRDVERAEPVLAAAGHALV
ncbi:MAG: ACT domain-containing protein [Rhizobium sp.]|nr:ACT domain-containing protein [Rhizobium sp.]